VMNDGCGEMLMIATSVQCAGPLQAELFRISHWYIRANARVSRAQYFNNEARKVSRAAGDSVGSATMR